MYLLAPFFTGSHRRWAEEYQAHSSHDIQLLSMPGRHWKWRMHGAAPYLAEKVRQQNVIPKAFIVTDMLDVASFRALLPTAYRGIPIHLYFHENQLTYPWSPRDEDPKLKRDRHYGWINFTSALAADHIYFNSRYHQEAFLAALPKYLRAFPDYQLLDQVDRIAEKSQVLYLGMALPKCDFNTNDSANKTPVIGWNHRWEYDKDPVTFFAVLRQLKKEAYNFKLIVLGEQFRETADIFAQAKKEFSNEILHFGYAETKTEYEQLLQQIDILPVTSRQDFFGGSLVEAMACGAYPLLPDRLAFPEHIPNDQHTNHLYTDEADLVQKLKHLLSHPQTIQATRPTISGWVQRYDWCNLVHQYDQYFSSLSITQ